MLRFVRCAAVAYFLITAPWFGHGAPSAEGALFDGTELPATDVALRAALRKATDPLGRRDVYATLSRAVLDSWDHHTVEDLGGVSGMIDAVSALEDELSSAAVLICFMEGSSASEAINFGRHEHSLNDGPGKLSYRLGRISAELADQVSAAQHRPESLRAIDEVLSRSFAAGDRVKTHLLYVLPSQAEGEGCRSDGGIMGSLDFGYVFYCRPQPESSEGLHENGHGGRIDSLIAWSVQISRSLFEVSGSSDALYVPQVLTAELAEVQLGPTRLLSPGFHWTRLFRVLEGCALPGQSVNVHYTRSGATTSLGTTAFAVAHRIGPSGTDWLDVEALRSVLAAAEPQTSASDPGQRRSPRSSAPGDGARANGLVRLLIFDVSGQHLQGRNVELVGTGQYHREIRFG